MIAVSRDALLQYDDILRAIKGSPQDDFPRIQAADYC